MEIQILGGAITFAIGCGISFLNYKISCSAFKKNKTNDMYISIILRQVINVAFLALSYFTARFLPWDEESALIGAAMGVLLPSAAFTRKLRENIENDGGNDNG